MKVVKITDSKWKVTLLTEDIQEMGFRPETVLENKMFLFNLIRQVFTRMQEDYNEVFAENVGCEAVRERDVLVLILTKSAQRTPEELLDMVSEQAPVMEPLNPVHFDETDNDLVSPYSLLGSEWSDTSSDDLVDDEADLFAEIEADERQTIQNRMEDLLSGNDDDDSGSNTKPAKRKSPLSNRKAGSLGQQKMLLIETNDFENLLALVKTLHSMGIVDSSVYSYNRKYVLWLTDLNMSKGEWQNLKAIALEYMNLSFESEHVLQEYGNALIEKDAVIQLVKTFHKED